MYYVNGFNLDNKERGWRLLRSSMPAPGLGYRVTELLTGGGDGIATLPTTREQTSVTFTVEVPHDELGDLLALFGDPTLVVTREGELGRTATGRLLSATPEQYHPAADMVQYSFLVEFPEGAWRSALITTPHVSALGGSVTFSAYEGISAPIQDALVRFQGPIQNPQLTDSSGAFVVLSGTLTAGQYLRFDSSTGRAYQTTSNTWTGGTEVSGLVDYGGPRGVFEITPMNTLPTDPRTASLTLNQDTYSSGAGVQIRARNSYLF